jgi:hypothetical protein
LDRSGGFHSSTPSEFKTAAVYAALAGASYGVFGVLQILMGIGIVNPNSLTSDPIGGIMLVVVALVYISGVRPLLGEDREGYAYLAVGAILGGILFVLQLIILGTNALGWWLQLEDWSEWILLSDLTPALLLFIPVLLISVPMHRKKRGHKTETDNEKGGAD